MSFFPKHIVKKYTDLKENKYKDFNDCCYAARNEMNIGEEELLLFMSKLVHRDKMKDYNNVLYTGQCGKKTNDVHFTSLINEEIKGKLFVKNGYRHDCFNIVKCSMQSPRNEKDKRAPVYLLSIEMIPTSPTIEKLHSEYYNTIDLHPQVCIKLKSMANYGIVPSNFQKVTEGVMFGSCVND